MKKILATALMSTAAAAGIVTATAPIASAEAQFAGSFYGGNSYERCIAEGQTGNYLAMGYDQWFCDLSYYDGAELWTLTYYR